MTKPPHTPHILYTSKNMVFSKTKESGAFGVGRILNQEQSNEEQKGSLSKLTEKRKTVIRRAGKEEKYCL